MTEFSEDYLYGNSLKLSKDETIRDSFDLFVFTVGWETRCLEITKHDCEMLKINKSIILSFKTDEGKSYPQEYMNKLKCFLAEKDIEESKIHFIEHHREHIEKVVEDIKRIIEELKIELGRPLNIGLDISSCPRYIFLCLLAFCLKQEATNKLSFFYSEGIYKDITGEYIFTKGDWKVIEIPGFESNFDPELNKFYIVSIGFEGSRYRSLIVEDEPDLVGVLLPEPGFIPEYTKKVCKECKPMIEEFNISEEVIVKAPAGDAIAAWKALTTPYLNRKNYNITYLTHGPKPHVLAMGIHGFLNKNIFVTYRIPTDYTRLDVEPTGDLWMYEIKNLIFL